MAGKIILCRCEDVTVHDIERAVATGFAALEEVKRYTGFGTGPCQGKECLRAVALTLARLTGRSPGEMAPFTSRPVLAPTELKYFVKPPGGVPLTPGMAAADPLASTATEPVPPEVDLAVVGGGIMGLALAYYLSQRGCTRVVVLEGQHLAWGASGRNGGGIRQQWSTEMNIRLMQESVEICRGFAQELGTNVWMRQGGYLFLARQPQELTRMEAAIALQNRCDVPTRLLSAEEVQALVPEIEAGAGTFAGACYNPTDAIVFPWPFLWGYARAAARRGVAIRTFTPVTAIDRGDRGFLLHTPRGTVRAGRVVNAAGAWSPAVAAMVGVSLPSWPSRHEILSTEPLKPFLRPMVSVLDSGLYFSQSLRGEVVGGITLDEEHQGVAADGQRPPVKLGSRLAFLEAMAAGLTEVIPRLGEVKVVRQWAGPYDMTPDNSPIVGEAPGVPGFFLCCGFVGHGFMMAPVVAKHYALHLSGGDTHRFFHTWRLGRFAAGELEAEHLNIG